MLLIAISLQANANTGSLVEIDKSEKCNFVVTKQTVPKGGEIRLRAAMDGSSIGFISVGIYLSDTKAIRGGKTIPVQSIGASEVFKLPIATSGKYALFLTKDGMSCENNVVINGMGDFDRISLGSFPVDFKIYVPEF